MKCLAHEQNYVQHIYNFVWGIIAFRCRIGERNFSCATKSMWFSLVVAWYVPSTRIIFIAEIVNLSDHC